MDMTGVKKRCARPRLHLGRVQQRQYTGNACGHVRAGGCAAQIENDLGLPEFRTAEEAQAHALQVMEVYRQSLPLISGLDEKERGLADELLPLCAWALVTASCLSGSPLPLLQVSPPFLTNL